MCQRILRLLFLWVYLEKYSLWWTDTDTHRTLDYSHKLDFRFHVIVGHWSQWTITQPHVSLAAKQMWTQGQKKRPHWQTGCSEQWTKKSLRSLLSERAEALYHFWKSEPLTEIYTYCCHELILHLTQKLTFWSLTLFIQSLFLFLHVTAIAVSISLAATACVTNFMRWLIKKKKKLV